MGTLGCILHVLQILYFLHIPQILQTLHILHLLHILRILHIRHILHSLQILHKQTPFVISFPKPYNIICKVSRLFLYLSLHVFVFVFVSVFVCSKTLPAAYHIRILLSHHCIVVSLYLSRVDGRTGIEGSIRACYRDFSMPVRPDLKIIPNILPR